MNKCKTCDKDIAKGVKKCIHCGKDQRNFFMRHKILTGFLGLIILVIAVNVASGEDNDTEVADNNNKAGETEEVVDNNQAEEADEDDTQAENKEEVEEEEDDVPREYKSALKKAETYANNMDMSKAAIYDQLVSEHGENFPEEAAEYAMDNIEADWKENALKKAETYANDMDMSDNAIYDQLVSEHGEQFTEEEAKYAIENL